MRGKRVKLSGTIESDVGYTGHHHHADSKLILTWYRAYDSNSGTWLSADPIGEAGGLNLYGYVGNDPINGWDPLGLRGYPSDFIGPLQPDDYYIPEGPPGADVKANCDAAKKMVNPWTFKGMVKNKGPWDYKQKGRQYESFGNYNYGATGNAFGLSLNTLYNEAGRAQSSAGTSNPAFGKPAPRWKMFLGCDGTGSRGDDPNDQLWIKRGFDWYQGQRPPPAPFVPVIPTGY